MNKSKYDNFATTIKAMGLVYIVMSLAVAVVGKDIEAIGSTLIIAVVGTVIGLMEAVVERKTQEFTVKGKSGERYMARPLNVYLCVSNNVLLIGGVALAVFAIASAWMLIRFFSPRLALVMGMVALTVVMLVIVAREALILLNENLHKKGIK